MSSLRTSFLTFAQREMLSIAEVHALGTSPQLAREGLRGSGQPGRGSGLRAPGDGEEAGGGLALLGDVWSHQSCGQSICLVSVSSTDLFVGR